ncbi:type II secretion system protein J [Chloroflexota bacterium]
MKSKENGFTLIGLVVALTISAIIAAGAGMTTAQIMEGSRSNNDRTTAVRQAQNVGYWVSRDALTTQAIVTTDNLETPEIEFIIAYWKDWETGDTHDIRYTLFDSADSLKRLERNQLSRDKDGVITDNNTTQVADNILAANITQQGDTWILYIEARSGEKSVTREYEFSLRHTL